MGDLVLGEQRPASCPTTKGGSCIFPFIYRMYPAASLWPLTLPPPDGETWTTCTSTSIDSDIIFDSEGYCAVLVDSSGTETSGEICDRDKCPLAGTRGWGWWKEPNSAF